jgi:hypothetical protein
VDISTKTRPPVITLDKFFCFKTDRVAHCRMVMEVTEQIMAGSRGDMGAILIVQDGINDFPVGQHRFHQWKTKAI